MTVLSTLLANSLRVAYMNSERGRAMIAEALTGKDLTLSLLSGALNLP